MFIFFFSKCIIQSNAVMSADDDESVILRSLECGVAFYIVKPVSPKDLKNVWQYAVAAKRGKFIAIEEIKNIPAESSVVSFEDQKSAASSVCQEKCSKKGSKRKGAPKMGKEDENEMNQGVPKRAKLVWTNSLHCRFLEAINHIGLDSKRSLANYKYFSLFVYALLSFQLQFLYVCISNVYLSNFNSSRGCAQDDS